MFSRYNFIFILFLSANILAVVLVARVNEPLDGDQTRIGGFRENDFGWNEPQEEFEELLFTRATALSDYTEYYDIVVYGDSFTFLREKSTWLNYLVDLTGWSAIAFHHKQCDIQAILNTEQFRRTPPRVLIFQGVERGLVDNLFFQTITGVRPAPETDSPDRTSGPLFQPLHSARQDVAREKEWNDLAGQISETESFLSRMIARKLTGGTKVRVLDLQKSGRPYFSSRSPNKLLVFKEDFRKFALTDAEIVSAAEKLETMSRAVEANRQTLFIPLIIPDKLTVYTPFLQEDVPDGKANVIARVSEHYPILRLDSFLAGKVEKHEKDIFLPNDTHTGSQGNRHVAQRLAEFIRQDIGP